MDDAASTEALLQETSESDDDFQEKKQSISEASKSRQEDINWSEPCCKPLALLHTANAYVLILTHGLGSGISGPCLPYIIARVHSSYEGITVVFLTGGVGAILGGLGGGYLCTKYRRHRYLLITLGCCLHGISIILTPWCTNVSTLACLGFIGGLGASPASASTNSILLEVWGRRAAPFIHTFTMIYGVGTLVGPQIARPFLHIPVTYNNSSGITTNEYNTTWNKTESQAVDDLTKAPVEYAYSITFAIICLVIVSNGATYIIELFGLCSSQEYTKLGCETPSSVNSRGSWRNIIDPATCTGGRRSYGAVVFVLIFLYYFTAVGGESCLSRFTFTYAVKSQLNFTVDEATYLSSSYALSFTLGRLLSAILSRFLHPQNMLHIVCSGAFISSIVFLLWGSVERIVAWCSILGLGLFVSPMFANGYAWADRYLEMTPFAGVIPFVSCDTGTIIYGYAEGYLTDHYGVKALPWMCVVFAVSMVIIDILMQITTYKKAERFSKNFGIIQTKCNLPSPEVEMRER